ncbi:Integral membrane protein [Apiospora marii]|uniref:Integral membrane protein n=1 Tax=Apiospora marii TaxID=335849 RepID=UPI00312EF705
MPTTHGVETFLPAPPGFEVNFTHPQRRGDLEVYWVTGLGNVLMLFFVGQRLCTKVAFSNGLLVDDGLLILAWLASIVVQGVTARSYSSGVAGVHAWEIPLSRYESSQLAVYITTILHIFCAAAAKLSLSIFYLRLSPSTWYRRCSWVTTGLLGVYSFIMIFCMAFACSPVAKAWRPNVDGTCLNRSALFTAAASMNTLTDIILFALPIPMVYGLQMPIKRRLAALGIFAAGLLIIIASLVRFAFLPEYLESRDQTWTMAPLSLWTSIEVNLFVICPSMLTLYEFSHETKRRWTGKRRRLSLESLPVTSVSLVSMTTLKSSTTYITTVDCGVPDDQPPQRDQGHHHQWKKWNFFGGAAANNINNNDHQHGEENEPASSQPGPKGRNGSQVSIGLCDEADVKVQRSASKLSMRGGDGEGDSEKGILMTTTVTVKHEEGP